MQDERFLAGSVYVLGRPPTSSIRFFKVLDAGPSHVYLRPYADPPEMHWELSTGVPSVRVTPSTRDSKEPGAIEVWEVARDSLPAWLPYVEVYSSIDHHEQAALNRLILEKIPIISDLLKAQLERVEPSIDGDMEYRPCRVRLRDGAVLDRVLALEAEPYIKQWGGWPQLSSTPSHLDISEVASLEESPFRLPARLATKMYEAGESGMGYCFFTLVLHDGRRLPVSTGNAVDFPDLPAEISPEMVADILPHEGRDLVWQDEEDGPSRPPQAVRWCLYRAQAS